MSSAGYPYPWSVVCWLPGMPPQVGRLADALRLALELARFLQVLHRLPVDDAPLAQCWQAARAIAAHRGAPVWIHGDIAPGNLLLADGAPSAAIDWSGCGAGDPADDARIAWNLLPAAVRPAFRAALGLDDAAWARAGAGGAAAALPPEQPGARGERAPRRRRGAA
jgi:aminoglycoside phosphotransferase (APT) family kinase protein